MFNYKEYIDNYKVISNSLKPCWKNKCDFIQNTGEIKCVHSVIDSEEYFAINIDKAAAKEKKFNSKIVDALTVNEEHKIFIEFKHIIYEMIDEIENLKDDGKKYYDEFDSSYTNYKCMAENIKSKIIGTYEFLELVGCNVSDFRTYLVCKFKNASFQYRQKLYSFGCKIRNEFKIDVIAQTYEDFSNNIKSFTIDVDYIDRNKVF